MDWETIGIIALILLVAFAAVYSMRTEPTNSNVVDTINSSTGHHIYSVGISDSLKVNDSVGGE